ncbi:hypothetical protein [Fibrobacter sp.]|uniref:hypothetical protein n=1 Tax=Fibrobacter sp. TaxID=35828 RepID=UPI00388E0BB4
MEASFFPLTFFGCTAAGSDSAVFSEEISAGLFSAEIAAGGSAFTGGTGSVALVESATCSGAGATLSAIADVFSLSSLPSTIGSSCTADSSLFSIRS